MHIRFKDSAMKDPWFVMGAGLVIIFGLAATLGPAMAPYDPWDMSFTPMSPASGDHLLGVNDAGQDINRYVFCPQRRQECPDEADPEDPIAHRLLHKVQADREKIAQDDLQECQNNKQ